MRALRLFVAVLLALIVGACATVRPLPAPLTARGVAGAFHAPVALEQVPAPATGISVNAPAADTAGPVVTILVPTSSTTFDNGTTSTVLLSGTASDVRTITGCTWANSAGGSGATSGTNNWVIASISLAVGSNVLTVTCTDIVGNTGNDVLTVTRTTPDVTPPVVTITSPTSSSTYDAGTSATVALAGTASDAVGVTGCTYTNSLGGSGSASGTTSWSIASVALTVGSNVITVACVDAASNQGTDVLTVTRSSPSSSSSFPLELSSNGQYLVDQNGLPFFVNGDTAWSLVGNTTQAEMEQYLDDRAAKGFNAIIVNLIEHRFSDNPPNNLAGNPPFSPAGNFGNPQSAYWAFVDTMFQEAAERNIVVFAAPLYLGFSCGSDGFCAEVQAETLADMTAYGQFIGARYANQPNIVWMMGGDVNPVAAGVESKLMAVVNGILSQDSNHLMTAHNFQQSAINPSWANNAWINLNNVYTYDTSFSVTLTEYNLADTRPLFFLETDYERAPCVTISPCNDLHVRRQAWWSVLSGARLGHFFGNCPLWGFDQVASYCTGGTPWTTQLNSTLSNDLNLLGPFFRSRDFTTLEPDQTDGVMTAGDQSGQTKATTARAANGTSVIAYIPTQRQVTIDMTEIGGTTAQGWWYNPRSGATTNLGTFATTGTQNFTPPDTNDWVLVLDDASLGLPAPGTSEYFSSNPISSSRRIDWSAAGVTYLASAPTLYNGANYDTVGIPPGRTQCMVSQCMTVSSGTTVTAASINSALAAAPAGTYVLIPAGTYSMSTGLVATGSGDSQVTLRGMGANSTFLVFSGANSCNGFWAAICFKSVDNMNGQNPTNVQSCTSGVAQGSTTIVCGNKTNLSVGSIIVIDQLDDTGTDAGFVYTCDTSPTCTWGGSGETGTSSRQGRMMNQIVTVTSVQSGTCAPSCSISFTPALRMPSWSNSKSPQIWYPSTPIQGMGLEDLSIDGTNAGGAENVFFHHCAGCWIKGVRSVLNGGGGSIDRSNIVLHTSPHVTIRDSYFYGQNDWQLVTAYGLEIWSTSDSLIENNIIQMSQAPIPINGATTGLVIAHNYALNMRVDPPNQTFQNQMIFRHGDSPNFILIEGNIGAGVYFDNFFSISHFWTLHRNRFLGRMANNGTTTSGATQTILMNARARLNNITCNVLGLDGFHTGYVGGGTSVFGTIGSASATNPVVPADPNVGATLFRWGNYTTHDDTVRWLSSEVPSGIAQFANPVPGSQTCMPSYFRASGKPNWWPTAMPYPAIGPDVTGGTLTGVDGHAYPNPAYNCFHTIMGGNANGTGAPLAFDRLGCYPGS